MTYAEHKSEEILVISRARSDSDDCSYHDQRQPFNGPRVLGLAFSLCFNLLLAALCACLALLWHYSKASNGFDLSNANHYVLTYGPTAALVWVVAAWRQIDHHTKVCAPWQEIHQGTSIASKSLLLDYLSVFQAAAFWSAIKNRHISVALTIIGFVLLKTATLASTGLFVLGPVIVEQHVEGFIGSNFIPKSFLSSTAVFDQSLLYTTYGVLVQKLQKPLGLGDGLAYPVISLASNSAMSGNITAELSAFVPSFDCQIADMETTLGPANSTETYPVIDYGIRSPACSRKESGSGLHTLNPQTYRCPSRQLSGMVESVDCMSSVFGAATGSEGVYKLLVLADMRYEQVLNSSESDAQLSEAVQATAWGTKVAAMTGIVCRLSYAMKTVVAAGSAGNLTDTIQIRALKQAESTKIGNFSDADLDSLFRAAISASDSILGSRTDEEYALEYPDPTFKSMAAIAGGSYESLLNASTMKKAGSVFSRQLAAQIAHQYLRDNTSKVTDMLVTTSAVRLKVTTLSAWVAFGTLSSVIGINIALMILRQGFPIDDISNTVSGSASICQKSTSLQADLIASQHYTESQLTTSMRSFEVYSTRRDKGPFEISLDKPIPQTEHEASQVPWWQPITVSWAAVATTFFLTVGGIAALEVIQQLSDEQRGFAELSLHMSWWETLYTRFIPALVALLVATLFNCLEFNVLLLTPYHKMRTAVPEKEMRTRPLISQAPPLALGRSLSNRHWAAAACTCAALVGSVMTIVVSGLYEVQRFRNPLPLRLLARDSMQPFWPNSVLNDRGAALLSSLTENLNFPYPSGTFAEIAFPALQIPGVAPSLGNSSLTSDITALRAHLLCTVMPSANVTVVSSQSIIQNTVTVNATYALPPGCLLGGPNGTGSTIEFVNTFTFPTGQNSTYLGKLLDLHVGPFDPIFGGDENELNPILTSDNPVGCPSIGLIYGFADLQLQKTSRDLADNVAVEVCYQQLQEVQATLFFKDSSFAVDELNPPRVNESSVRSANVDKQNYTYTAGTANATALQFRPQSHFDDTFVVFNTTNGNPFSRLAGLRPAVDPFFQGVLFGKTPIPLASLQLQDDSQRGQIRHGILAFYRRYMAQAISLNMRVALDNSSSAQPQAFEANATTALLNRRIVQNNTSKLVLQLMLAFMFVCGVVAISTIKMRRLLPACSNPCTIWGQMSLWAGSRCCSEQGPVRYWPSQQHLGSQSVVSSNVNETTQTLRFRLGWWYMQDGTRRYGIDVVDGIWRPAIAASASEH